MLALFSFERLCPVVCVGVCAVAGGDHTMRHQLLTRSHVRLHQNTAPEHQAVLLLLLLLLLLLARHALISGAAACPAVVLHVLPSFY